MDMGGLRGRFLTVNTYRSTCLNALGVPPHATSAFLKRPPRSERKPATFGLSNDEFERAGICQAFLQLTPTKWSSAMRMAR